MIIISNMVLSVSWIFNMIHELLLLCITVVGNLKLREKNFFWTKYDDSNIYKH